jgi:hypothetical protein
MYSLLIETKIFVDSYYVSFLFLFPSHLDKAAAAAALARCASMGIRYSKLMGAVIMLGGDNVEGVVVDR